MLIAIIRADDDGVSFDRKRIKSSPPLKLIVGQLQRFMQVACSAQEGSKHFLLKGCLGSLSLATA